MPDNGTNIGFYAIFIAGAGFFADAYDLFVINIVVDIMALTEYKEQLTDGRKALVKSIALVAAIIGQIGFGAIADLMGRRTMFITTCALVILGSSLSSCVQDWPTFGIYSQLCVFRFILGLGVGGEYPLSAAVTSENSSEERRIPNLAAVFCMQGFGTLSCAFVLLFVTQLVPDYDLQWRIALGLGSVPMILVSYFRWTMHETTAWTAAASGISASLLDNQVCARSLSYDPSDALNCSFVSSEPEQASLALYLLMTPQVWGKTVCSACRAVLVAIEANKWTLLGSAGSWFILDIVFYGNGLFSGQVTSVMGMTQSTKGEAIASVLLQSIALPGYLATVVFVESVGLRRLQLVGFAATAVSFLLLAALEPLLVQVPTLYVALYGITFFFQNFGPNATTYVLPSIAFAPEHKATCHGISAASGKLGAIIGASAFVYIQEAFCPGGACNSSSTLEERQAGVRLTFFVCGVMAILGWAWTWCFVDYKTSDGEAKRLQRPEEEGQSPDSVLDCEYSPLAGDVVIQVPVISLDDSDGGDEAFVTPPDNPQELAHAGSNSSLL